jgi:Zn-dependent peptidase ImmA (M78 family)
VTTATLAAVGYSDGAVSLDAVCAQQTALTVRVGVQPGAHESVHEILGRISFRPLEIITYAHQGQSIGRQRFTLAHELGHLLLGHGEYVTAEACARGDLEGNPPLDDEDLRSLDWQANQFASFLLLPLGPFVMTFMGLVQKYDLRDHGHGLLYVDEHRWNLETYYAVTGHLKAIYGVSRAVVDIRLKGLGFLHDARTAPRPLRLWGRQ